MPSNERKLQFKILRECQTGVKSGEKERFHAYHEMFYVSEGQCSVFIGQRVYRLCSGEFAVIPAGSLHRTDFLSVGQNTKYVISFSEQLIRIVDDFLGEKISASLLRAGTVRAPVQRQDALVTLLNRMLHEYENESMHSRGLCRAFLAELLISVARYRAGEEENDGVIGRDDGRFQEIAAYICNHSMEQITLRELSDRFAMSPSHLSRSFRKATGFGIREYLIQYRIQKASVLLMTTDMSITEIADQCGFSDSNYFGDAFKKATGLSPREYRKIG